MKIQAILFKLANNNGSLPKHSLIVVYEDGVIGNDDIRMFLSAAATCRYNITLSSDDRQISSVGCDGMFEICANHYFSSNTYNINRQSSKWGKSIAVAGAVLDRYLFGFILSYFISFRKVFPLWITVDCSTLLTIHDHGLHRNRNNPLTSEQESHREAQSRKDNHMVILLKSLMLLVLSLL